jgi:S-adenosylmethionine hydrolase
MTLKGIVIRVDKFGNLITNITPKDLPQLFTSDPPPFKVMIAQYEITKMTQSYAEGTPGEVFVLLNSMGFLEIASHRGSAAQIVGAGKGADVAVQFESGKVGAVTQ